MIREITDKKLAKYFEVSQKAYNKATISVPEGTHLYKVAQDYLMMAKTYIDDAKHFQKKNDIVNAFAALNYAHGWLDAGARLGIFDVGHDSQLFTVD